MSDFGSSVNQNVFGLVALVVSLVALITTVLQVLQQYCFNRRVVSSAEGYRRCVESVMGPWAVGTHRKLRLHEFRIEVVFETPVLFTASPWNDKGPIKEREIVYIDGSQESYRKSRVLGSAEQERATQHATLRVHTADDERASWVTLLSTLQEKESSSREWDQQSRRRSTSRPPAIPQAHSTSRQVIGTPKYSLSVGLQVKTRSWDFIPSSITKPYATTAICHLVEMMAMLGLYWKVFDQATWNLRAEGNGFILTSTTVHGLGVMVVFAKTGKSEFKENRVIPCKAIKDLAFGTVPNIFDDTDYLTTNREAQSLNLTFGTADETENTLELFGCQAETLRKYKKDHKHIFSLSFEIIGMLGKVFRIRGSNFRMLPNPTNDSWLKKKGAKASWKITTLMEVFQKKVKELIDNEGLVEPNPVSDIYKQWERIKGLGCSDETELCTEAREAIHDSLDKVAADLLEKSQSTVLNVLVAHITKVTEILDDPNSQLNTIVLANKEDALLQIYFYEVRVAVIGNLDSNKRLLKKAAKDERNVIWIALIFRMLCWFLLHDFDKADVKIVPSDLIGSRMPVFVG